MSPETVSAFTTITAGLVMVYLGARKRMIEPSWVKVRCPACGKLYRQGDVCSCSEK